MNIPVFEKITFNKVDISYIKEMCIQSEIGLKPHYLEAPNEEIELFINNFLKVLEELNIHPYFPYPIYVLTNKIDHHSILTIIKKIEDLPHFFPMKMQSRARSRFEGKNNAIIHKMRSTDLYDRHQLLRVFAIRHKMVLQNSAEIDFYKTILKSHYE